MERGKEQQKMKRIRVGFYGERADVEVLERARRIREFLVERGGSCWFEFGKSDRPGAEVVVELVATIPEEFAGLHHGFDSKLNSTDEGGFGVEVAEGEED